MTVTAYGIAADPFGLCWSTIVEQGELGPRLRHRSWQTPADRIAHTQPGRIIVDEGHDGVEIGLVRHIENRAGSLWLVAEIDRIPTVAVRVGDEIKHLAEPMYWSLERTGEAIDPIQILSVALTPNPARTGSQPVRFAPGRPAEAAYVSTDSHERALLRRAAETDRCRHGGPLTIHGDPQLSDEFGYREGDRTRSGDFHSRELPGGLRRSAHHGQILSVR